MIHGNRCYVQHYNSDIHYQTTFQTIHPKIVNFSDIFRAVFSLGAVHGSFIMTQDSELCELHFGLRVSALLAQVCLNISQSVNVHR